MCAAIAAFAGPEQNRRERTLLDRWSKIYSRFNEVLSGMVTVSYRVTAGVLPGGDGQPRNLAGHSIFEVQDDKVIRIWHHLRVVEV